MRLREIIKNYLNNYIINEIYDPALTGDEVYENTPPFLMTFREYYFSINDSDEFHDSDAYNWSYSKKRRLDCKISKCYPIKTKQIGNISLNFVIQKEPRKNVEDIEEELGMIDVSKYRYDIFCLHNDVVVGGGQDEWGCVLIYVVKEFRNLGIGEELVKMYREIYPYKPSGGFTESGYTQILKYYNWMVKRALSSGVYSKMVREGKIKMDRVKEILASVDKKIKFSDEKKSILIDKYKLNNEPLYIISENNVVIFDSALKDIIRDYHKNNVLDELIEKGIYAYAHLVEYLDVIQLYNCYGEEKYVSEAIEILVNLNPEGIGDFYFKNFNSETKNMLRKIWDDKDKYKIEIMDYYQPVNIIKPKKSIIPKIAFLKTIADRWFKINDKYEELYYSITELADGLIE